MAVSVDFALREDIKKMLELDKEVFSNDFEIDVDNEIGIYQKWYDINKYQWLVAKDEQENLVGYLNIYHLTNEAIEEILANDIEEKHFKEDYFVKFKQNNNICCYIDGFVVKNSNTRVAIALLNKTIKYFRFLKDNNIIVSRVLTVGASNKGIRLCNKLGFKRLKEYEPLKSSVKPNLFIINLKGDSVSHLFKHIKEIFLENDKYL